MGCVPCQSKAEGQVSGRAEKSFARPRLMADGSFIYPKKGFEPPPPIEGYDRDPNDAWKFIPRFPECKDRLRTLQMRKCGAYDILMVCGNQECPLKQSRVTADQCKACQFRKEA